jgi:hypothetical protein
MAQRDAWIRTDPHCLAVIRYLQDHGPQLTTVVREALAPDITYHAQRYRMRRMQALGMIRVNGATNERVISLPHHHA